MTPTEKSSIEILEILEEDTSWSAETAERIHNVLSVCHFEDPSDAPSTVAKALRSFAACVDEIFDAHEYCYGPDILDQIQERAGDLGLGEADSDAMFITTQAVKDFKKENA